MIQLVEFSSEKRVQFASCYYEVYLIESVVENLCGFY